MTASMKMIVSEASRMFSAISFGVFCRLAPSTRAIIRSMKLSPGFWVISTTIRSDSTRVPPVTELRSPPLSRITGALSPVMALSSTLAMPSMTSPSPGMMSPASQTTTSPCRTCGAGIGLCLAPSLGHRLRDVREQRGQPEPDNDQPGEHARIGDRDHGGEHGTDLDDEHDRVLVQRGWIELADGVRQRRPQHLGVEQTGLDAMRGRGRWRLPGRGFQSGSHINAAPPRADRE